MDGWVEEWRNGLVGDYIDGLIDGFMHACVVKRKERMHGWIDEGEVKEKLADTVSVPSVNTPASYLVAR